MSDGKSEIGVCIRVSLCLVLSLLGCSAAILATLSKNDHGGYDYNTSNVPFLAESVKLGLSSWMLIASTRTGSSGLLLQWRELGKYFLLGGVYTMQNNFLFYTLKQVNPATFQVLINVKIPLTALLMHIFLKKAFNFQQQAALLLLVLGAILSQVSGNTDSTKFVDISVTGGILISCMVCISSVAGVFNEYLLKSSSGGSIHWQNVQLYTFGCVFSFIKMALDVGPAWKSLLFSGFNTFTWLSIANMASLGLATSAVLKYADNMLRSFASVGSVILATILVWWLIESRMTLHFISGAFLSSVSLLLYTEVLVLPSKINYCRPRN